jgi:sugar O-acyltransferase (sialic acid O-acetyltransferase NeuD family)
VSAPLILVGAGGFARETLELIGAVNRVAPTWDVRGLLDDDPARLGELVHGVPVLGPTTLVHEHPDARFVAAVASPREPMRRLDLVARLGLAAERYVTLVHPAAVVARSAEIGPGCVMHAGVVLTADLRVGAHVAAMPGVVLTHDDVIGDGVTFASGARIGGGVTIGRGAYVGAGALLRENLVVGERARIGMGAVVTRSVPAGETWIGVPAACHSAEPAEVGS